MITICTLLLVACNGGFDSSKRIPAEIKPERTFEQDGNTYAIYKGDVFENRGSDWSFVDSLYDPSYRSAISRRDDGRWQVFDADSGKYYEALTNFRTGFEGERNVEGHITESLWHQYTTNPKNEGRTGNYVHLGNQVTVQSKIVRSGKAAMRFQAEPDSRDVSKASIRRGLLHFEKGDTIHFSAWYFIEPTPDMYDAGAFTILDLESTYVGYLGFRLIFQSDDSLGFETKFPKRRYKQDRSKSVPFPQGRWVNVKLEAYLDDQSGRAKLWQDGTLVLEVEGPTLTVPDMIIDNIEVGATVIAKGSKYRKVVYVDDLVVSNSPISSTGG